MADLNSLLSDIETLGAKDATPLEWNQIATAEQSDAPLSLAEKVLGYSRSYLGGPTLGYADNLEALLSSVLGNQSYEQNLGQIRGEQQRFKDKTDYLDNVVELASGAVLNPFSAISKINTAGTTLLPTLKAIGTSVPVQAAVSTIGNMDGEATLKDVGMGAAIGTGASMLSSVVGKALTETARNSDRLKLSAYGIGNADITKQVKKLGDNVLNVDDVSDLPLVQTLKKAESKGLINAGNDMLENAQNISKRQNVLGNSISTLIKEADAVTPANKTYSTKTVENYIDQFSGTAREKAQEAAIKEITALDSQIKTGSLEELQKLKIGLNYKFDDNPYTDDVIKALRSDLRQEIENRVDKAATNKLINESSVGKIKKLNREWGEYDDLKDTFVRKIGRDVQGDMIEDTIGGMRTSGGMGSLNVASAASGNPLWAWLGAGLNAARVPESKSAIADVLSDPVLSVPIEKTGQVLPELFSGRNVANMQTMLTEDQENSSGLNKQSINADSLQQLLSEIENLGVSQNTNKMEPGSMSRTPEFDSKVDKIAQNLDVDPEHLFKAMAFETGGTFDSAVKNKAGSGATGLIQFMPETAKQLTGANTKEAAIKIMESMTPTEQLDYVEKYLKPFKGKLKSLEDVYMAILYPKAVGKDNKFALFQEGTKAYWQNRGLDLDKDGVITKLEAASKVKSYNV